MILLPAVDIRDGRAVRLRQGNFDEETVYADDPLDAARSFVEAGARFLHVVDLDGAREGEPVNTGARPADHRGARRTGRARGGLRSIASIRRALAAGASRVVLGTAAFTDPDLLDEALSAFTSRISSGWTCAAAWCPWPGGRARRRCAARTPSGACSSGARPLRLHERGPRRDAEGPRPRRGERVSEAVRGRFLSGGIGSVDDLRALASLRILNSPARRRSWQGAEEPLRRARGPGGARGLMLLGADPVPRRGQGPRGEGRRVREPARRGGSRRARRALPRRGRRRDRLPRHHGIAREARDRRRAGAPLCRRRLHPVHDRRRRADGRGRPSGARRGC